MKPVLMGFIVHIGDGEQVSNSTVSIPQGKWLRITHVSGWLFVNSPQRSTVMSGCDASRNAVLKRFVATVTLAFPEADSREISALLASSAKRPEKRTTFWDFMMREIKGTVLRDR